MSLYQGKHSELLVRPVPSSGAEYRLVALSSGYSLGTEWVQPTKVTEKLLASRRRNRRATASLAEGSSEGLLLGSIAAVGEPDPSSTQASIVTEPMPTRVLALVPTQLTLKPPKRTTSDKRISEAPCDIRMIDGRNEPLHVAVPGPRSQPDHRQPTIRVGVEVVRTLIEVEQLPRPDRPIGHVEIRRTSTGLIKSIAQLVEFDRQQNQIRCGSARVVLEFGNEFSVASPAPLTQRIDDQTSDRDEGLRAFDAQDGTTSVLETIDRNTAGQRSFDRRPISARDTELLRPDVTTHRPLLSPPTSQP